MCTMDGCGNQKDLPAIAVSQQERRLFVAGLASLPLATILAYPELAAAQADTASPYEITTPDGAKVTGVIAMPETLPAPAVLLIHEWWGLNDQIKTMAAEMAKQGYIAFAVDMYDGEVGTTPEEAMSLMKAVDANAAKGKLAAVVDHLRNHESSTGKVGTMGWCFGGGWSINASIAAPVDATVVYYGRLPQESSALEPLSGPVLGHFGTLDKSINEAMVTGFESAMDSAGKSESLTVYWYEADHAFANPTGARYDADDAALAWQRTTSFLSENLGS